MLLVQRAAVLGRYIANFEELASLVQTLGAAGGYTVHVCVLDEGLMPPAEPVSPALPFLDTRDFQWELRSNIPRTDVDSTRESDLGKLQGVICNVCIHRFSLDFQFS